MALFDAIAKPLTAEDVKGTIWESLASLKGGEQAHPFAIDSPTQDEPPMLVAGQTRRIAYRGSGQVMLYNIDMPAGVTMALVLDGVTKRYSHGSEAGVLRWEFGKSPLRFTSQLEVVVTNTTAAGQTYRVHVSGA